MKYTALVFLLAGLPQLFFCCPNEEMECVDIQEETLFPVDYPGPYFEFSPLLFHNPLDANGDPVMLTLEDRGEDLDGLPELNIPFSYESAYESGSYAALSVEFPEAIFENGVRWVSVELRHFNSAKIIAIDIGGNEVATATLPGENIRRELTLESENIRTIKFHAVETLIYKICWRTE